MRLGVVYDIGGSPKRAYFVRGSIELLLALRRKIIQLNFAKKPVDGRETFGLIQ